MGFFGDVGQFSLNVAHILITDNPDFQPYVDLFNYFLNLGILFGVLGGCLKVVFRTARSF